jgi:tRNA 2-thiouridine synthesizing protein A
MSIIIDARGFSCPQPVLVTLNQIKKMGKGEIVVLVDTVTSRENVSRAAISAGWTVRGIDTEGPEFRIRIVRE